MKASLSVSWEMYRVLWQLHQVKAHQKVIDWFRTLELQAEQDAKGARRQ